MAAIAFAVAQVPSNMVLVRVGAPAWLGAIVVSWGVVATMFAGLRGVTDFYLLRFLLGVTECGTFPGMWCAPALHTASSAGRL